MGGTNTSHDYLKIKTKISKKWAKCFYQNLVVLKGSTEGMKIEKAEKPVANFHDKKDHVIYIRNLKQTLNHWIGIEKSA